LLLLIVGDFQHRESLRVQNPHSFATVILLSFSGVGARVVKTDNKRCVAEKSVRQTREFRRAFESPRHERRRPVRQYTDAQVLCPRGRDKCHN